MNIHICAFSGGAASAKMSQIVKESINDIPVLLFHDTKTEDEDTYRFAEEVAHYLGLWITHDSDGRDIWEVFKDEGYLGNGRNTMCSRILKQERSMDYLKKLRDAGEDPILYVGFTSDEWQRAQRVTARYIAEGFEVRFPLIDNRITKDQCHREITECWGIELPRMYEHYAHANCMPCIKGKKAYWGLVYMFNNKAWERAVQAESEHNQTIFTEAGSLTEELDNCLRLAKKYIAKRELQALIDSQEGLFDTPCECIT